MSRSVFERRAAALQGDPHEALERDGCEEIVAAIVRRLRIKAMPSRPGDPDPCSCSREVAEIQVAVVKLFDLVKHLLGQGANHRG